MDELLKVLPGMSIEVLQQLCAEALEVANDLESNGYEEHADFIRNAYEDVHPETFEGMEHLIEMVSATCEIAYNGAEGWH